MISINEMASLTALKTVDFATNLSSLSFSIGKISFVAIVYKSSCLPNARILESKPRMAKQNKQNRTVKRPFPMTSMCQLTKVSKRVSFELFHTLIAKTAHSIRLLAYSSKVPYMLMHLSHRGCQSLHR